MEPNMEKKAKPKKAWAIKDELGRFVDVDGATSWRTRVLALGESFVDGDKIVRVLITEE